MMVIHFRVRTLVFVPIQFLGSRLVIAVGTFVSFWPQTEKDPMTENGRMSQFNLPPVTMEFRDFTPTVLADRTLFRTCDRDDVITFAIYLHAMCFYVWNIQGNRNHVT